MLKHFHILCIVTALWAWFFLGGLGSNYYQDWPFIYQLVIVDIIPCVVMVMLAPAMIKFMGKDAPIKSSFIAAFYFSVPFLLYDYIYLGLYKSLGIRYLWQYWYLSGFSILPWITFPLAGYAMARRRA